MLSFRRKSGFLTITHKYYCDEIDSRDMFRLAVYYQARLSGRCFGFISRPFYTVVNALDRTEQEMLGNFTSTVRNEVRRSERENVRFELMNDVEVFRQFHNEFASAKRTYLADKGLLDGYKDKLFITCAKLGDRVLAAHAYLCDSETETVRLLFSSNARLTQQIDANFIGRANKYLHFKDMIHFRDSGYRLYDFGGFAYNTSDRERQGINAFKRSFGGELVRLTDYQSWLYWSSSRLFYGFASLLRKVVPAN